jgi:hypothetical protein
VIAAFSLPDFDRQSFSDITRHNYGYLAGILMKTAYFIFGLDGARRWGKSLKFKVQSSKFKVSFMCKGWQEVEAILLFLLF